MPNQPHAEPSRNHSGRSAIVVAHPGHELRVYYWMEQQRPLYCCLTEGSGGSAESRLSTTTGLLKSVGASPGPLYGRYPDKQVYRLLLDGEVDVFVQMAQELADALVDEGVECVVGDAVEGFNPVHDVCRFVTDGAAALAARRSGRLVRNYDFVLDGRPDACPDALRSDALWLTLDEAALARKIDAALEYPELRAEVTAALMIERFEHEAPAYESYGAIRVNEGRYEDVIRYRDHVLPVRLAIEQAILQ